ncbi:MAG: SMP-30/gluconolactonase/LRE family protein [Bryobacteraceae bacterium]|nr:SMP-30/gluconolactonase/LRE family protein [Bryobacteraceae bacterium]
MPEAKSPEFWNLIDRAAKVEKVSEGFRFTEGPVFSRRGYLLFSDIPSNRIMKYERGKVTVFRENSNAANGLTFDHQGRLLACEKGRVTRTEKNGQITVLASEGLEGPNDLVYAIDGSIYFTDLPKGLVYQIPRRGQAKVVARDNVRPNGVALAPNQQKLYVADVNKEKPVVRVYEIAPDGTLGQGRVFCEVRTDGLKSDEAGNVWLSSAGGVHVYDASGRQLGLVDTPEQPANCCWGSGFAGLYITARTSLYHIPTKVHGTRTY